LFIVNDLSAQNTPFNYTSKQIKGSIEIDGKLNEPEWESAKWTTDFVDIEGVKMPKPFHQTGCKVLWDKDNLYVAAVLKETDLWASLINHDATIYLDNAFEVFIDPNGDGKNYYEIEVNALNAVWDLMLDKPYRDGGIANSRWNATGMKTAVSLQGSLNNPMDRDFGWSVELAIPWKDLIADKAPNSGDIWRVNFLRVQWQLDVVDGKYIKRKISNNDKPLISYWVWTPQHAINMHLPECWGFLHFE
jgi:hypothetical protein